MKLGPGTRFNAYEIIELLGAGGMGEVYRARDTRLGREVAIKVLPEALARDPERLRRFEQEARATSLLNHPNIVAIYDIGEHEGRHYMVTELLEGETLRQRIAGEPLPARKAVEYALQAARGLAAAHEKGIVHRDLKPDNIFITRDARVKILDFGLAKVEAPAGVPGETLAPTAAPLTQAGVVLGTALYMSPEQVRGEAADHRSDIFSFGAVLYEMLAGRRAFERETAAETMTAILREDPPELPAAVSGKIPPALDRIVRHCLEKRPEDRFRSAHDLAFALETTTGISTTAAQPVAAGAARPSRLQLSPLALIALAAAVLLAGVAAGLWFRAGRSTAPTEWTATRLDGPDVAQGPRISPDGRTLAFQAFVDNLTQVAVMNPDSGHWTVLTHDRTRGLVNSLCWSPDGSRIYYDRFEGGPAGVFAVPALGGEERLILEDAADPDALPDGSLLVTRINPERKYQIHRFWPATGRLEPLPALPDALWSGRMRALPGGKEAVFYGRPLKSEAGVQPHFWILDLVTSQVRRLDNASPLDLSRVDVVPMGVHPDGSAIVTSLKSGDLSRVVSIPRDGKLAERTLLTLTQALSFLDVGPDGSVYIDQVHRPLDVLRFPASGGTPKNLATAFTSHQLAQEALQLPDGRCVLPARSAGKFRVLIGRPGKSPLPMIESEEETSGPLALIYENDERQLALMLGSGSRQLIAVVSVADGRIVRRLEQTRGVSVTNIAASPDGRTLYYSAAGSVWSIPAQGGEPRKIRAGDGVAAHPNGRDLIVKLDEKEGSRLVRVPLDGGAEKPVPYLGALRLAPPAPGPGAVRADGRMVVGVLPVDSWFFSAAVLDLESGKVEPVPLNYVGDIFSPGWSPDGKEIVTLAHRMQSSLWRFRPASAAR